jgi:hypothetical protein
MPPFDSIIIEHPTRGVLRRFDASDPRDVNFHFSVTGLRSDPEYSFQFMSVRSAAKLWALMPIRLRDQCQILARKAGQAEYKAIV